MVQHVALLCRDILTTTVLIKLNDQWDPEQNLRLNSEYSLVTSMPATQWRIVLLSFYLVILVYGFVFLSLSLRPNGLAYLP